MKIIAGKWRGRALTPPKGPHVRPTSSRGRAAFFNTLAARTTFEGAYVADLFCGTGALGLEALSRGAKEALFIDLDLSTVKKNILNLGATEHAQALKMDATTLGFHPFLEKATLIFMDPPYGKNFAAKTLEAILPFLKEGALIAIETETPLMILPAMCTLLKQTSHGKATLTLLEKRP